MTYLIGAHLKASFPYHFGIEKESNVRTLLDVMLPLSRFELKYSAETVEKVFLEGLIFHRNQILGGFSKSKSVSLIILAGFPFNLVLRT